MSDTVSDKTIEERYPELFDETFLDALDPEVWDIEAVRIHNRSYAEAVVAGETDMIEHLVYNQSYLRRKPKVEASPTMATASTES
jgi:hypothetical protein